MPQLTIAIPTYNRCSMLKKGIGNLLRICEGFDIEILVSDNHSTDGTQLYMEEITKQHANVRYFRNDENIGPDRNFLNCYNKAVGTYTLLMGDDDTLLPGGLAFIMEAINRSPVIIHLNSTTVDAQQDSFNALPAESIDKMLLVFGDRDSFLREVGIYITFVSSLVLRTDLVRIIANIEQYFDTNFLQSHVAMNTMKEDGIYIHCKAIIIQATGNNTVNYDVYHVWGKCYGDLITRTGKECGFGDSVLKTVLYESLKGIILNFVIHFRKTCKGESTWRKEDLLMYVNEYPDLIAKYKQAMGLPRTLHILYYGIRGVIGKAVSGLVALHKKVKR